VTLSQETPEQTLRIIDANLDRIGEGLRLLEDLARFLLNDAPLTRQLKTMRHELVTSDLSFKQKLLQARHAQGDVGVNIEAPEQMKEKGLAELVVANAQRAQQSLRVVEELAKMPGVKLDREKFKKARFNLYTIERELLSKLLRKDKARHISGLYIILDTQSLNRRSHLEVAREMIRGGAKVIQLRDKMTGKGELLAIARKLKSLCAQHGVLFIVNDYLDLALAADADGLHLGQDDLPVEAARRLLPLDKILGCSVTTVDQATAAQSQGADYIAVGAIYPTSTREMVEVIGLERLRLIKKGVSLPLVAIGGINQANAAEVLAAGADSVAVISAILQAESPEKATRQIIARIESKSEPTDR